MISPRERAGGRDGGDIGIWYRNLPDSEITRNATARVESSASQNRWGWFRKIKGLSSASSGRS